MNIGLNKGLHTVHPSIMLGSYIWDEERLPRDEFDIRGKFITDAMEKNNWAGLIVYGDAPEHGALAWFTNFIPRMRWAMGLYSTSGDKRVLASMSSRDIPAMRTMTMIDNVKSGWEWKWFDEWVATLGGSGTIGIIGLDQITPLLLEQAEKSFGGNYQLADASALDASARQHQRPRELAVIREAAAITTAAKAAFEAVWRDGADIEHAALAGERQARAMAAQDIRTLVSRDNGRTLQPYRARFEDRPDHLLGYIAVKYLGYWADSFVELGAPAALASASGAALKSLIDGIGQEGGSEGKNFSALAAGATGKLAGFQPHPVLSGNFGGRIGLSLCEYGEIRADASATPLPGTAYSLRAGVCDAQTGGSIASALVVTKPGGGLDVLLSSGLD